jgi:sec-independent protein translocase protein TatA
MTEYAQYLGFWTPGPLELAVIGVVALLIFGRRLPEIARNVGKSLTEFKKGLHEAKEVQDDLTDEVRGVKDDVIKEAKDAAGLNETDTMGSD